MAKLRTFVAFDVPPDVRDRTAKIVTTLSQETESIRWVNIDNLHVTLKFIGDVEDREIYSICKAVQMAVNGVNHFSLPCRGIGAFPSVDRPRTIWAGIDDTECRLTSLFARLESELSELGIPPEPRKFIPHLTLGRIKHARKHLGNLSAVLDSMAATDIGWLPVEELTVYTSELRKDGPVYTVVSRVSLGESA